MLILLVAGLGMGAIRIIDPAAEPDQFWHAALRGRTWTAPNRDVDWTATLRGKTWTAPDTGGT